MEHFCIKLINRGKSFKLVRDEFALVNLKPSLPYFKSLAEKHAYSDERGDSYSKDWCNEYRELCLKNFDLNMKYFSALDEEAFNLALMSFLSQYNRFTEVTDLNKYTGVEGFYIMVLDEYKQVYIGKSSDIKRRIMQHWSKTKAFDRTLLPMYAWETSCFSIDFFRALDTTRIFAWKKKISDGLEAELVSTFPAQYCTNRIGGDVTMAIQAIGTMNTKNLL